MRVIHGSRHTHIACTFSGDGHMHWLDIGINNYFKLCREPQSFTLMIYRGLKNLAFGLLQTQVALLQALLPSHVCSHACTGSSHSLIAGKIFSVSGPLCCQRGSGLFILCFFFSKQTLLTAGNSPRALAGAWNFAQGPLTHRTGWELRALPRPEGLRRKEGGIQHSRLIYWSWTLDLYLQPSLSSLPKSGSQEECLSPSLCMCSGLYWSHAVSMKSSHGT